MAKLKLLLILVPVVLLLGVLAQAVLAQTEPPPPYTGLKNPFPWSDASAQEAGKKLYQQSCLGCHGITGGSIAAADFSQANSGRGAEESPALYFWALSEGRLSKGMPPFKSSLSEEQRWQVLTYLRSLGEAPVSPAPTPPPPNPAAAGEAGRLLLVAPQQAEPGQLLLLTAILQDSQGRAIRNAGVKFLVKVDFFATGLMEVGEAVTDEQGTAVLEYTPRQTGEIQIATRYEAMEATATLTLAGSGEPFYQPDAGLHLPALGQDMFLFPNKQALEPRELGAAPGKVFRIPGGLQPLPLVGYVLTIIFVWSLYFYVMYQGFRIPVVTDIRDMNTRLIPTIGMAVMVVLALLLVVVLVTGPFSHAHLLH